MTSPLDDALAYTNRRWPVFPCKPWPDKSPYTDNGWHDASTERSRLIYWWKRWPEAIIGLPTGKPSGVVVLDIDVKEGNNGFWTLADDFAIYDPPETPQVFTPSGGLHLYFDPGEHEIRNTNGKRGRGIGCGLDWRGEGGYVIIPSKNSGYAWHSKYSLTPLPIPTELLPREPERQAREPVESADGLSPYARAALNSACRNIVGARAGEQEATLNGECFAIGNLAGAGAIPERFALNTLLWTASQIRDYDSRRPWRTATLEGKVKRAFADGLSHPREARHG